MNYPGSKLTVHVLDDGRNADMAAMVKKLKDQCK